MGVEGISSSSVQTQGVVGGDEAVAAQAQVRTGASDASTFQKGANGTVSVDGVDFQCTNGKVSFGGCEIGSIGNGGEYKVCINGQTFEGNVCKLAGAKIHGSVDGVPVDIEVPQAPAARASQPGPAHRPEVAEGTVTTEDGSQYQIAKANGDGPRTVLLNGKAVGTVDSKGDFDVQGTKGNMWQLPGVKVQVTGTDGRPFAWVASADKSAESKTAAPRDSRLAEPGRRTYSGRLFREDEGFDHVGNVVLFHRNREGKLDGGYQVQERAPWGQNASGAEVVATHTDAMFPKNNRLKYADGTEAWWDGKQTWHESDLPTMGGVPKRLPNETLETLDVSRLTKREDVVKLLQSYVGDKSTVPVGASFESPAEAARRVAQAKLAEFDRYDFTTQFSSIYSKALTDAEYRSKDPNDSRSTVERIADSTAQQMNHQYFSNFDQIKKDLAAGSITAEKAKALTDANMAKYQDANNRLRGDASAASAKRTFDPDALVGPQRAAYEQLNKKLAAIGVVIDEKDPNGAQWKKDALKSGGIATDPSFWALQSKAAQFTTETYQKKYGRAPYDWEIRLALPTTTNMAANQKRWEETREQMLSGKYFSDSNIGLGKSRRAHGITGW